MDLLKNKLYEVTDMGENIMSRVKIIDGDYKGVVYQYGSVKFVEQPDDTCLLSFKYEIFETPIVGLREDKEFEKVLGDILTELICMTTVNTLEVEDD